MSSNNPSEKTVSDVQTTTTEEGGHEPTVEHEPSGRSACPECKGRVITEDEQSFCTDCGLIVADEWVDLSPTLNDLGLVGDTDQSIETVDPLRTDKGLHTKIGRNTDGRGNPLSNEQWEKVQRLRKWHKRMQFGEKRKRTKRLNEGLRDVEMIGGNLSLPDHVVKMAAQFLQSASEARLPGGRMAWEALAGGAVLLAARAASVNRDEIDVAVATHTKAPHERVCAAARKIRCECGFDAPLIRPNAVMAVVDALDDDAIPGARAVRTWRLAQHLMKLGDQVPVGPGTPRCTVAASALYAADRLLSRKHLTQEQVAAAASTIVPTSRNRIARYSRELVDAYEVEHGTDDPGVGLEEERDTLR
ncbi:MULTISPECIES: transcription initiation factor IIB [Halolamina]|uniref:Transcription initiation factor TFIIB n=1 Tax=Halolamina pelagica TaxID=699431 RepID=A0A1I5W802_9EURY|nr:MULTISPECIES: transcription initiation factor IIB family protein [Halolamina]NHX37518.1 transcription initiation factor IIB family protein [Halolamina sp. R1-12]SFQ15880.1 transcription initiation factor TFIIB [Halolamina pelagica]